MFKVIDYFYRLVGNFGPRDPDRDGAGQAAVLPARQQVLRLDGEDEGGAARDGQHPRALCRRQG